MKTLKKMKCNQNCDENFEKMKCNQNFDENFETNEL